MRKIKFISFLIIIILIGCTKAPQGSEYFPDEVLLSIDDLPDSFDFLGIKAPEVDNGICYEIAYKNVNGFIGSHIYHNVAVFQSNEDAKNYYLSIQTIEFSMEKYIPSGLTFLPSDPSDIFKMGCFDVAINDVKTASCTLLQLHNNMVIEVFTNINQKNMDLETFNNILESLDSRLPVDNVPLPESSENL